MNKNIHRAKFVLTDPHHLLQDAALEITEAGLISSVGHRRDIPDAPTSAITDWGSAIILPGLINAHAHLELTSLCNRTNRFDSFTDWLARLISLSRAMTAGEIHKSVNEGIALSLASGTTTVGDISSSGVAREAFRGKPMRRVVFEEGIAFSPDRAEEIIARLRQVLDSCVSDDLYSPGISPHAPYSVSGKLYRGLAELALRRKALLATHVAETESEIRFLSSGAGEFRDFLNARGILPADWHPPGLTPIAYLHSLGVLGPNCLLIHCNYLDEASIDRISRSRSNTVYCPRSHAFFGHPRHPVRRLFDAGIPVALGTDSLASNATLSMIDEMRFLFRTRKDLKADEIFQAATLNGAKALHLESGLGVLEPGYRADMTILEIPSHIKSRQVPDQILEGAGECIGTIVGGQIAWVKPGYSPDRPQEPK